MTIGKALVVDDSRVAHVLLNKLLKERGIDVDWVGSGQEAVEYLKTQQSDVVFMDVMMPGMDGFETTDAITSDSSIAAPPIIMCSANATDEDHENANKCGAKGFLSKPYTPDELDSVLAMVNSLTTSEADSATDDSAAEAVELESGADATETPLLDLSDVDAVDLDSDEVQDLASDTFAEPTAAPTNATPIDEEKIAEIARTSATQAAQAAAAATAKDIATEIANKLAKETRQEVAKDAVQAARESAQTAAVEAARAVAKQAMKIVSDKIPNQDNLRKDVLSSLATELPNQIQNFLSGDDFKNRINQLTEESARSVARSTAQETARQTSEDIVLAFTNETAANSGKSGSAISIIALLLSLVAIAGVVAIKLGLI